MEGACELCGWEEDPEDQEEQEEPEELNECACGHVRDEHGGDPEFPGSTACAIEDCDCICYEGMA